MKKFYHSVLIIIIGLFLSKNSNAENKCHQAVAQAGPYWFGLFTTGTFSTGPCAPFDSFRVKMPFIEYNLLEIKSDAAKGSGES